MQVRITSRLRFVSIVLTLLMPFGVDCLAQSAPGNPSGTAAQTKAPPQPQPVTAPALQRLALLLPLSGKQQAAGMAIRDGFIAAALQQPASRRGDIEIFDTNDKGVLDAYSRALQNGANMIVGPLLKEDVEALAKSRLTSVSTLALNTLSDPQLSTRLMFQFALDPEEEARQVAQRAIAEDHHRAIMLVPANEWGQRMQRAFAEELKASGDSIVDSRSYDPNSTDLVALVKPLFASRKPQPARKPDDPPAARNAIPESRDDFDFVFMAAQPAQARQVYPAIRFVLSDASIPVYATSDSYATDSKSRDIDALRVADMPWVINRDSDTANLYAQMERAWGAALRSRSRLYAFGIDAYKLCDWLNTAQPQLAAPLHGTTGLLTLDSSGRIHRQLDWAQIINGTPQPLPGLNNN